MRTLLNMPREARAPGATGHATVIQEGYLQMRNPNGTWKRRYFMLSSDGLLSYFKKQGGSPRGGLFLSGDFFVADSLLKKQNGFQLSNLHDRLFYLQAESLKSRVSWMVKLAQLIAELERVSLAAEEAALEPRSGEGPGLRLLKLPHSRHARVVQKGVEKRPGRRHVPWMLRKGYKARRLAASR